MPLKKLLSSPKGRPGKGGAGGCRHHEHDPPSHIVLKPGMYEWECPGCGRVKIIRVPESGLASWRTAATRETRWCGGRPLPTFGLT